MLQRVLLSVFILAALALNAARPWFGLESPETRLERIGRWLFGWGLLGTAPFVWIDQEGMSMWWRLSMLVWSAGIVIFTVSATRRSRARSRVS